jgi:ABC-2 type transport system permease protein
MTAITQQFRASYAFFERNINLIKRYWSWEIVWLVYSIADCLSVSFIGLGMQQISGTVISNTSYIVLYLLIGTLVWRFLSQIFYWITDLINIERWEGTIEYTLMAPVRRITHMTGQTAFAVFYGFVFTGVILVITALVFKIDLTNANLLGGTIVLLSGSFSFVGIGIMASVLPLLFPERGSQMTHVFIAILLLVSGVYYLMCWTECARLFWTARLPANCGDMSGQRCSWADYSSRPGCGSSDRLSIMPNGPVSYTATGNQKMAPWINLRGASFLIY